MAEFMHRTVRDPVALDPHPQRRLGQRQTVRIWTAVVHDTFPHDGRTLWSSTANIMVCSPANTMSA